MQSKARGEFPTERIKLVIDTEPKAFKKGTVSSFDLCFQVTIAYCSKTYSALSALYRLVLFLFWPRLEMKEKYSI